MKDIPGTLRAGGAFRVIAIASVGALSLVSFLCASADAAPSVPISYPKFLRAGNVTRSFVQPDGRIIVIGTFSAVNGIPRSNVARLNRDGSLDPTFVAMMTGEIITAVLQPDGKMILVLPAAQAADMFNRHLERLNSDGTNDTSFNSSVSGNILSLGLQSSGAIVVAGSLSFGKDVSVGLDRLKADGSRDLSFSSSSRSTGRITIGPNDKIYQLGGSGILRFNPDGALDKDINTHSPEGIQLSRIYEMAVQADGKLLLACDYYYYAYDITTNTQSTGHGMARLNADGTVDRAFTSHFIYGVNPLPFEYGTSLALLPDGSFLVSGKGSNGQGKLVRLKATGEIDSTFQTLAAARIGHANVEFDPGGAITLQSDGKLLINGLFRSSEGQVSLNLVRLNSDGALEPAFAPKFELPGEIYAVTAQGRDKVIVNGDFLSVNGYTYTDVVRLKADASVDTGFQGVVFDESYRSLTSLLVTPNNEIILNESLASGGALVRVDADGTTSSRTTLLQLPFSPTAPLALQNDGKLLVVQRSTTIFSAIDQLRRYNTDGSPDDGFSRLDAPWTIAALVLQPDGKILVGSSYSRPLGHFPPPALPSVLRLNGDGSIDRSFNYPKEKGGYVAALALEQDGRVLVGGTMTYPNNDAIRNLARLNRDGTLDDSFAPAVNGPVFALKVYNDGRILLGGSFTSVNGLPLAGLARLLPDATIDSSFDPGAGDTAIKSLTVLPQGEIFAVGGGRLLVLLPASSQLANISTRMRVLTGNQVLIAGFIITGSDPKKVMIRGLGPSLAGRGVPGALANPTLELHGTDNAVIATNDNWTESQPDEIVATGIPPANNLESALVQTLAPGSYTAILAGKDLTSGVGLLEVYDLDQSSPSNLANISTRGFVDTGDNVMIGGVIITGAEGGTARVLLRALGPSLTAAGVSGALADPVLELHDSNGVLLGSNDNWKDSQQAQIAATTIPPTNDLEAAIVASLPPGAYTAIVAGKDGSTGVGLVEVYNLGK